MLMGSGHREARIQYMDSTFRLLAAGDHVRCAITGEALRTEIGPLTGPMYQLLVFFMMTDPRTTVSTAKGRMITVAVVAVVESLFRLANDFHLPGAYIVGPAPAILALFLVGPIALWLDLRRKAARPVPAPAAREPAASAV